MRRLILAAATLLIFAVTARAADTKTLTDAWYDALAHGSDAGIGALLADDAVVVLEDIGVEQTKAEFVGALYEFRAAIKGGSVEHRIESATDTQSVALVCYRFPGNEMTVREIFTFAGDLIVKSVQAQTAGDCVGF